MKEWFRGLNDNYIMTIFKLRFNIIMTLVLFILSGLYYIFTVLSENSSKYFNIAPYIYVYILVIITSNILINIIIKNDNAAKSRAIKNTRQYINKVLNLK